MTLDASQVRIAGDGALYKASLGAAEPGGPTGSLAGLGYLGLGYFSADGASFNFEDSVQNHFAWQRSALVRTSVTESLTTLAFTPIQSRGNVLEAFYRGSEMTEPTPGNYRLPIVPPTADPSTWVFDAIDGDIHYRYYIPNGEITQRGEVMHRNGDPIGYPMTMTFYPDSNGVLAYLLSDDPSFADGFALS